MKAMTTRPRLLALDLDGTILGAREALSPDIAPLLQAIRSQGVVVVLATGRRLNNARWWSERLGIGGAPLVAADGAVVTAADGRRLVDRPLSTIQWHRAWAVARQAGIEIRFYGATVTAMARPGEADLHCWSGRIGRRQMGGGLPPEAWNTWRFPARLGRFQFHAPRLYKGSLIGVHSAYLRPAIAALGMAFTTPADDANEFIRTGLSKATGLAALIGDLGLTWDQVWAVGDGANDRDMLAVAGLGVAMGQATAELRHEASRVVAPQDQGGLLEVLQPLAKAPVAEWL